MGSPRQALRSFSQVQTPLLMCPRPSQAPAVYTSLPFQLPSVHIYQVASVTPALVPFIESPFGDPAALWMPVTQS